MRGCAVEGEEGERTGSDLEGAEEAKGKERSAGDKRDDREKWRR